MKFIRLCCLLLISFQVHAEAPLVYQQSVNKPADQVYDAVYEALETAKFFVVFEANIGKNLANFATRWGQDYNKNQLSTIRSMVFCNAAYANRVSNLDPTMLGFCPLHLTIIAKQGKTTVLFNRPSVAAGASPARAVLREVETEVITAIKAAMAQF